MSVLPQGSPRSLLNDVVSWMLAPLAVLWPVSIAATYAIGVAIADGPFDRELIDFTHAVAEEVRRATESPRRFPLLERARTSTIDSIYAQVARPDGTVLAGDGIVPKPAPGACEAGRVQLRSVPDGEGELRVACEISGSAGEPLVVQVAETMSRRREHATRVTMTVMGVVIVIVPIFLGLAIVALVRGLRPLQQLRDEIAARGAADLRPLPLEGAPSEVAPLLAALNHQLERVRGNLASQRRFVADAAHQLRTPLAGLKTQAQVARGSKTLDEALPRLERIGESADHLSRLATQLLSLARADDAAGAGAQPVDLAAVLRVACHDAAPAAIAKSIRIALDVPVQPVTVPGDADLLHELFANLIDNAVRYTPPGGEVTVRAAARPVPVVEVEDSGPGIAVAERDRVFERFYRILGSGIPGSGLGLSIVRSIAARHGATVTLEAGSQGLGALFRVAFAPRVNP